MSMSTRRQTTCFQTLAATQDSVHARQQPKAKEKNSKVISIETKSSQIHKRNPAFSKSPFHFSSWKMTSVHHSFSELWQGGGGEEVKAQLPIRLWTAFFFLLFLFLGGRMGSCRLMWCVIWGGYPDREPNNLSLCWHIPIKSFLFFFNITLFWI